jgi:ATP-dependent DNA helicase PIF1
VHSETICSISAQSDLAKLLQMTKLIVWDEAPAQHRHCFEAVDRTLKDLRKSSKWFGGITMVFGGWFPLYLS